MTMFLSSAHWRGRNLQLVGHMNGSGCLYGLSLCPLLAMRVPDYCYSRNTAFPGGPMGTHKKLCSEQTQQSMFWKGCILSFGITFPNARFSLFEWTDLQWADLRYKWSGLYDSFALYGEFYGNHLFIYGNIFLYLPGCNSHTGGLFRNINSLFSYFK